MLLSLLGVLVCATSPRAEVRPAPIFLVVRTAATEAQGAREARLHDEVSLLLDNFAVLSESIEAPTQFQARPLAEQLALVLDLARRDEAVAALWIAEPLRGQLMVHVVGIGSGRALIRTLEFDQKSSSEKALALIVRELLGTAFLQTPPQSIDPGLADVVRGVRRALPVDPLLDKPAPVVAPVQPLPPSPYSLSLQAVCAVSLLGAQGRWVTVGAQLRGERQFGAHLGLGVELEVHGARDFGPSSTISSLEVPLGLTASLEVPVGALSVVPRLSVLGGLNQLWAQNPEGIAATHTWTMRARAGVGVRSNLAGPVQVQFEVAVDAVPVRGAVRDQRTDTDLWRAPWLEIRFAGGVFWKG